MIIQKVKGMPGYYEAILKLEWNPGWAGYMRRPQIKTEGKSHTEALTKLFAILEWDEIGNWNKN